MRPLLRRRLPRGRKWFPRRRLLRQQLPLQPRSLRHLRARRHPFARRLLLRSPEPRHFDQQRLPLPLNNPLSRGRPPLPLALRQVAPLLDQRHRYGPQEIAVRCRPEIAARCPIFLANVRVAPGQDNRFVRSSQPRVDR